MIKTNQYTWDNRFLELAKLISTWSKDPSTKVGAVIVGQDNTILGTGYNGFPRNVEDNKNRLNNRPLKYKMIVHAELNAILNSKHDLTGSTIYVYPTMMEPNCCNECTKAVIQAGIKRIVYYKQEKTEQSTRWIEEQEVSKLMCDEAGIKYWGIV